MCAAAHHKVAPYRKDTVAARYQRCRQAIQIDKADILATCRYRVLEVVQRIAKSDISIRRGQCAREECADLRAR